MFGRNYFGGNYFGPRYFADDEEAEEEEVVASSRPTEPDHAPTFRTINLSAEIKKIWGPHWNAPETSYEFSSGRKFTLRTEDVYESDV